MLKYIRFLLSDHYLAALSEHMDEICQKVDGRGAVLEIGGLIMPREGSFKKKETLFITDESQMLNRLLAEGYYVIALYHDSNRDQDFAGTRYAVADVFLLEYRSYEQAFQRLAGLPWEILETDRLKVRESVLEDIEEFYRIYQEPSITYYMEGLFKQREEEYAYMKAYIQQIYGFYGFGLWTVIQKATGRIIGRAGLSVREGYGLPELGFVIEASQQRKGFGYEVCSAILRYAKEELQFDQVQALVKSANTASLRLLERLGFLYDRDVVESEHPYQLFLKNI